MRGRLSISPAVVVFSVIVLVLLSFSCGPARYEYVTNRDAGAFLRIPAGWKHQRMSGPALYGVDARYMSPEAARQLARAEWLVGIDAGATFDESSPLIPDAPAPKGFVQARTLLPEEADAISTNDLRNLLVPVDASTAAQRAAERADPYGARLAPGFTLQRDERIHEDDGVHGVHLIYEIRTVAGLVTIDQTSLLDRGRTTLYQLVLACSASCYASHAEQISQVQESFTVEPAG